MANDLVLTIRGRDRASSTFAGVGRAAQEAGRRFQAFGRDAQKSTGLVRTAGGVIMQTGRAAQAAGAQVTQLGRSFDRAATQAKRAVATMAKDLREKVGAAAHTAGQSLVSRFTGALSGLPGVVSGFAKIGGATLGALGTAFGGLGIAANKFKEETLAAFTGMTKSRKEAEKLYNFLSRFADVTPFDDTQVIEAGKALRTFGLDVQKYIGVAGDTAAAMKVDILQVVHALAKLKFGSFDTVEHGAIGLSRTDLEKRGVQFSASGEPKDRSKLFAAGTAALQEKFGGTMGSAGSGFEARASTAFSGLRRIAIEATSGLFESLKKAFAGIASVLEGVLGKDGGLIQSLAQPFNAIGQAIEGAVRHLPQFVRWLEQVASAQNVQYFLINATALVHTLGESLLKLFGVDLQALLNPSSVLTFIGQIETAIASGIRTVFGLGRVWKEVGVMIRGTVADVSDWIGDFVTDTGRMFRVMGLEMRQSLHNIAAALLESMAAVGEALNSFKIGNWQPFKADVTGLRNAGAMERTLASEALGQQVEQRRSGQREQEMRTMRDRLKDQADPFRRDDPFTRMADAFFGNERDRSAEDDFFARLEKNRQGAARFLFAGANRPKPGASPEPAPARITQERGAFPAHLLPSRGQDMSAPVTLPNGRVITAWQAMQMRKAQGAPAAGTFRPIPSQALPPVSAAPPRTATTATPAATNGAGTSITINLSGIVMEQLLQDPRLWQRVQREALEAYRREAQEQMPGTLT